MDIVATINFYMVSKGRGKGELHTLPFILKNRGLRCVWVETTNEEITSLKLKSTYNLYISKKTS